MEHKVEPATLTYPVCGRTIIMGIEVYGTIHDERKQMDKESFTRVCLMIGDEQ